MARLIAEKDEEVGGVGRAGFNLESVKAFMFHGRNGNAKKVNREEQ